MEEQLFTTILYSTATLTDAHHRLGLIRRFVEDTLFQIPQVKPAVVAFETYLAEAEIPSHTIAQFRPWAEAWLGKISADSFHEHDERVLERIASSPKILIIVPIAFSSAVWEDVGSWVRAHTSPDTFIDVLIDQATVGGCRLVRNGRYADFSFRYFIQQHARELREVIRMQKV